VKRRVLLLSGLCFAGISPKAPAPRAAELPRLAILSPDFAGRGAVPLFLEALRDLGYVDGRNIRVDTRFAENRLDLLPALAEELVKTRPDVIYTYNTAGALASTRATTSIPIVAGPVGEQTMELLAGNFAQPVANVTGFISPAKHADEKLLQLLKEAAPNVSRIVLLLNPDNPVWRDYPAALSAAADQLGLVLIRVDSRGAADIDRVLGHLASGAIDGLQLMGDSTLAGDQGVRARVIEFAYERRLPSASATSNATLLHGMAAYCSSAPIWITSSGARPNMCTA